MRVGIQGCAVYLCSRLDLQGQVLDAQVGDLGQQRPGLVGVLIDPGLALGEELGAAALDHVAEEGPGGAAEADERDAAGELAARDGDGLVDVAELPGDVDVARQQLAVLGVGRGGQRVREGRALLVHHLDLHAHGLRDDQDVREDDGGVQQPGVALDGLQGQRRGHLRVAAALEEVARALGLVVLGEVAAGWEGGGGHVVSHSELRIGDGLRGGGGTAEEVV